jgi:predicted nuclease of predicted toxin-antitoxin system
VARFLADENFPLPVVEELRRLGHDVVTVADVGKTGQSLPDEAILLLATADVRTLLTLNRKHFIRLHASLAHHAGIIVCTLDLDFAGQARRIHAAIAPLTTLAGCLVRVNRPAV